MAKVESICLVDDDDIYQFLTMRVIEETNLVKQIRVFSNGLEAIEFLRDVQDQPLEIPEIILLDLNMPVMDGWGFLEEYVRLKPHLGKTITLLIVSSSIDPIDIQRAKAISEVSDFIIKPISKERLIHMLQNL
jgi:CheY-like chemotaxis protein